MKQILLKTWLTMLCLLVFGAGTTWAEEVVSYTFATEQSSSNTAYANNYDVTIDKVLWNCPGNQNFSGYVRIGGKSLANATRDIYSKQPLSDNITKVVLNHQGVSNSSLTVNSITLTVASDESFTNDVQTSVLTSPSVSTSGSLTFLPSSGTWGANKYYKITFNLTNSKTSNYGLDVASIAFYKDNGGLTPSHTAYFSVNGSINNSDDQVVEEGQDITFPSDPADIEGKKFQGWTQTADYSMSLSLPRTFAKLQKWELLM